MASVTEACNISIRVADRASKRIGLSSNPNIATAWFQENSLAICYAVARVGASQSLPPFTDVEVAIPELTWQELYKAALLELDREKLNNRVEVASRAIHQPLNAVIWIA